MNQVLGSSLWDLKIIINLIFYYSDFPFLLQSVLVACVFLRIWSFILGFLICGIQLSIVFLYDFYLFIYFCHFSNNVPTFIPDFSNLAFLLFFYWPN